MEDIMDSDPISRFQLYLLSYQAANVDSLPSQNFKTRTPIEHLTEQLCSKDEEVKELKIKVADDKKRISNFQKQIYRLIQELTKYQSQHSGKKELASEGSTPNSSKEQSAPDKSVLNSMVPGISKQLFDSVVRENIRLQRELQHLVESKGINSNSYMEAYHLENVIEQLRKELQAKDQQLQEITKRAVSTNTLQVGGPVPQIQVLSEKKQQICSQLVTALAQKNITLKQELQEMKEIESQCLEKMQFLETQLNSKESKSSGENEKDQVNSKEIIKELEEKYSEEMKKSQHFQEMLQKSQNSLILMKKDLETKIKELQQKIKSIEEDNEAFKTQIHQYKDDWEKENAEKVDLEKAKAKQSQQMLVMQSQLETVGIEKDHLEKSNFELENENRQLHTMMPGLGYSMAAPTPAAYSSYGFEQKPAAYQHFQTARPQQGSPHPFMGGGLPTNVVADSSVGPFGGGRDVADSSDRELNSPNNSGQFRDYHLQTDSPGIGMGLPSNRGADSGREVFRHGLHCNVADSSAMGGTADRGEDLGGGPTHSPPAESPVPSECPRCQREFMPDQGDEFHEHVDKCLDS